MNRYDCALPIQHNLYKNNIYRQESFLDWGPAEQHQGDAPGTPLVWTTNKCSKNKFVFAEDEQTSCNDAATLKGSGFTNLNKYGDHFWLLDVQMDCSKSINGWFEFKSLIHDSQPLEGPIEQTQFGDYPKPVYESQNHFARCGAINVFKRNQDEPIEIIPHQ